MNSCMVDDLTLDLNPTEYKKKKQGKIYTTR